MFLLVIGIIGLGALVAIAIMLSGPAMAASQYTVAYGGTSDITEWSVCKRVVNSHASGASIMVPTNSSAEWVSFYTYPPAGVSVSTCPPPPPPPPSDGMGMVAMGDGGDSMGMGG